MSKAFSPTTAFARAVHAGKYEAVVELMRSLSQQERKSLRSEALALLKLLDKARWSSDDKTFAGWGAKPTDRQVRAASAAAVVCGSAKDAAEHYYDEQDLAALLKEFQPPSIAGLADEMLAISPHRIRDVQHLIVAGLIPRPASDAYAIGLIALPGCMRVGEDIHETIAADKGLPDVLLRIMEVEGTSDVSLAALDKFSYAGKRHANWSQVLRRLCAQGIFSRATLLDRTLAALENDWPQFRSSWFSRFHEELEPSVAEMAPHTHRYLALCGSRIPPTVTMALGVLKKLDEASSLDPAGLLEALKPVLSSGVKAQVDAGLKMLDALVARDPSRTADAAPLVAPALAHTSADVQKQVLRRLTQWGVGEALRRTLREYVPVVAAVNRKALEQLVAQKGVSQLVKAPASVKPGLAPGRVSPLDPARIVAPIASLDELVERIAYVFENPTEIDEFERAVGALVQSAPFADDSRSRFDPLVKRVPKLAGKPMARELARLVMFVLSGVRLPSQSTVDSGGHPATAQEFLISRIDELMDVAAQGKQQLPLSTPTHRLGFIDPALFVERVAGHQERKVRSPESEQVRALLRLAPGGVGKDTLARARKLADEPFTRALRYALGDDIKPGREAPLFAAAARIRHPGEDDVALAKIIGDLGPDAARAARHDWRLTSHTRKYNGKDLEYGRLQIVTQEVPPKTHPSLLAVLRHPSPEAKKRPWYSDWSFAGIDEGTILYSATLLPSCLEAFFAEGARVVGHNLDWWEARWQNRAYLSLLLEPTTAMTPMATLLLALGLGGKEAGQTAIAVDALVRSHSDGRLDVPALARTLRDLLSTPLAKSARYARSLSAALRIEPGMAEPLFDLLCTALEASPENPPRDTALLLDLLQEVMLTSERALPAPARATIESLKLAGRAHALRKQLLGR